MHGNSAYVCGRTTLSHDLAQAHYGRLASRSTGYELQALAARRLAFRFPTLVHVPRAVGPASAALGAHETAIGARTLAARLSRNRTVEISA